jgi:hypothetical protein
LKNQLVFLKSSSTWLFLIGQLLLNEANFEVHKIQKVILF